MDTEQTQALQAAVQPERGLLLIVDDDEINCAILENLFAPYYDTDTAENGRAGLDRVLERQDDLLYRILGSGHSVGLLAEGSTLAATRQLLEEGGQVLERVGYTRTTLALVPESQRSALEAEGWVCWDETGSAIPEAGTGASSHANAVIRAIPSRSQQAYITLDAGSESARVLPTLLTRLEARSYAVSVPLETRL